jgi:hypothetical protein
MAGTIVEQSTGVRRCPRCQGPMFRDDDSRRLALLCLLCGEYQFPSPPRRRPTVERGGTADRRAGAVAGATQHARRATPAA